MVDPYRLPPLPLASFIPFACSSRLMNIRPICPPASFVCLGDDRAQTAFASTVTKTGLSSIGFHFCCILSPSAAAFCNIFPSSLAHKITNLVSRSRRSNSLRQRCCCRVVCACLSICLYLSKRLANKAVGRHQHPR